MLVLNVQEKLHITNEVTHYKTTALLLPVFFTLARGGGGSKVCVHARAANLHMLFNFITTNYKNAPHDWTLGMLIM